MRWPPSSARGSTPTWASSVSTLPTRPCPTRGDGYEVGTVTEIDLAAADISTVLWATGFSWDYRWLPVALDAQGYRVQDRGVTEEPGLYFVGLHFLHTRKSGLFLGVGEDAEHVADHVTQRPATRRLK